VREDVLRPDVAGQFVRAREKAQRLVPRAAEQQDPTARTQPVRQVLDRIQPCPVERRHVPQAQDDDRRKRLDVGCRFDQLLGRPEQKRAVDAQDGDVGRNLAPGQLVYGALLDIFVRYRRDGRCLSDPADIEQRGQHHSYLDRDRQVRDHGQEERHTPYGDLRPAA